jgi:hypothetical protein
MAKGRTPDKHLADIIKHHWALNLALEATKAVDVRQTFNLGVV